ncbi:MAG: hypothetical protein WAT53_00870 [Nitrosomonas sp.]|nr:hypothetical protein [Nitrosomonas sp.]
MYAYAQPVLGVKLAVGSRATSLHAASTIHAGGVWHSLYLPYSRIGPVYPAPPFYPDCFLFFNCGAIFAPYPPLMERRQKLPPPAKVYGEQYQPDVAMEAWRASLRSAPTPFRTDERLIQPQFRDHSLIRPEYEKTGKPLLNLPSR